MKKILSILKMIADFLKQNKIILYSILVIFFMYMFLYSSISKNPMEHDPFDQYTRQAKAWTEGKVYLDEDLSYLEIAEYEGKYYVSFPPVPSLMMVPLYLIFDLETPNAYVVLTYTIMAYLAVFLMLKRKTSKARAAFLAFFFVFASSALVISLSGDVWFHAQIMAFMLTLLSIACATSNKKKYWQFSLLFIALAVGCRPLNIIYFVPIYFMLLIKMRDSGEFKTKENTLKRPKEYLLIALKYIWIPAVIGAAMMLYNYVRFDSPFVFGHRYLPNFTNGFKQFDIQYFLNNLYCTFRLPEYANGVLEFPHWDGFAFWMCCPFYIYAVLEFILRKKKALDWVIIASFFVHFTVLLFHRGMGGFQFGTRYMIDLMPYALMLLYNGEIKHRTYAYVFAAFGLMINVYGVPYHYLK